MKDSNPKRFIYIRLMGYTCAAFKSANMSRIIVGLLVCLTAIGIAQPINSGAVLMGFLESDLGVTLVDLQDPNDTVDAEPVQTGPDTTNVQNTVTEDDTVVPVYPENTPVMPKARRDEIERDLWWSSISVAQEDKAVQSQNELEQLIQQINRIEIDGQMAPEGPEITADPATEVMPEENIPPVQTPQVAESVKADRASSDGSVSEQTLELFKNASQRPGQLENPFKLAEILFRSGCLKEAAVCYREALNRIDAENPDVFQDKPWILLQLGNCLRSDDPQAAQESYQAVMTEYPDSVWAPMAKAKNELVDWYLQNQPQTLIDEMKP